MSGTGLVHDVVGIDGLDVARYGGKAAGLARMTALGMPVPPAFVIETSACLVHRGAAGPSEALAADVRDAVHDLEERTGKVFAGDGSLPLLVSVRSGAQVSMPGMMDTVLNLGLDVGSALRLADACGDPAFVLDTWTRFWVMYADIVLDVDPELLRKAVDGAKLAAAASLDEESARAFETAVVSYLAGEGCVARTDPWEQLHATIGAVFDSWDSRRAKTYRKHHGIPDDLGTAVTVQAMVFGNLGTPSGSGVAFTRDPATGQAQLFGEYLSGGQGEEVVAGTHTPTRIDEATGEWIPLVSELTRLGHSLEAQYLDALDIEFTVEGGVLYLLQVRPAKRTAQAAVSIATQLVESGQISVGTGLDRVTADQVGTLVTPRFDQAAVTAARESGGVLTTGIPASPGHATGVVAVDPDRAADLAAEGVDVVLVRPTTSPQDLHGMITARAVITQRGGATSHAAVVSRALDKPCVVGCEELEVDLTKRGFSVGGTTYDEGVTVSVDGGTGEVFLGTLPLGRNEDEGSALTTVLGWADTASKADVWMTGPDAPGNEGAGVFGLVDVLARAGRLEPFVAAVDAWAQDANASIAAVDDVIEKQIREVCEELLAEHQQPLQLRVPSLGTSRARRLLDHWTSLAPEQLAPFGSPRLLEPCARAVRAVVEASGRRDVTLLIAGITTSAQLAQFVELVGDASPLSAGAVLQSAAAVYVAEELATTGRPLWIDLESLTRSVEGRSDDLLPTRASDDEHVEATLARWPLVAWLLGRLPFARGSQIGLDLPPSAGGALAAELHDLGVRRFAGIPVRAEQTRLLLGQHAQQHTQKEKVDG